MDLLAKIRTIPTSPGCYLYKNAEGEVIYVGKAKNLRARVRSYFLEANQVNNRKTGSLMREAVDIDYITVDNEREALALENNLIKQRKPRFNILLRDDKTYPYIKLTMQRPPPQGLRHAAPAQGRRRSTSAPSSPATSRTGWSTSIHRSFLIPSLQGRPEPLPPARLPAVLHQALPGPCVEGFISQEHYAKGSSSDVQPVPRRQRTDELETRLTDRMAAAAENMQFEARRAAPRPAHHRPPGAGQAAHRHRR